MELFGINLSFKGTVFAAIVVFFSVIFMLYLFANVFLQIGIALVFAGFGLTALYLIFPNEMDGKFIEIAFFLIFIGILTYAVGNEMITFFEFNPTGKNAINGLNCFINKSKIMLNGM